MLLYNVIRAPMQIQHGSAEAGLANVTLEVLLDEPEIEEFGWYLLKVTVMKDIPFDTEIVADMWQGRGSKTRSRRPSTFAAPVSPIVKEPMSPFLSQERQEREKPSKVRVCLRASVSPYFIVCLRASF